MPYKDPEQQLKYQREWIAKRRAKYLENKVCAHAYKGGCSEQFEIDHVDPEIKWNHRIWSYSWAKILAELAKCQVLCTTHHYEKTARDIVTMKSKAHGTVEGYTKYHCRCEDCNRKRAASIDQNFIGLTLDEAKEVVYA